MAKVLIAPIGTGAREKNNKEEREYRTAKYEIDGKIYERSFISSALVEHYEIDKVYYIGTLKSLWEEAYRVHCEYEKKELDWDIYTSLVDITEKSNSNTDITEHDIDFINKAFGEKYKIFIIKYGKNESELLDNFDILMDISNYLENGDELFIDVTHSFRSLSMYIFLILNYLTDIDSKNIEIKHIFYGMLELSSESDKGISPVVNLQILFELLKWIKGANDLKNNGNAYLISELIKPVNNDVANKLKNFSDILNINNISSLKSNIESLNSIIEKINSIEGPCKRIVPKIIEEFLSRFKDIKTDYKFQIELARWHYENKKYSSSFIILHESILTFICVKEGLDFNDKDDRDLAKDFLRNFHKKKYLKNDENLKKLKNKYNSIGKIRNNIAHSTMERKNVFKTDIDNLPNHIKEVFRVYDNSAIGNFIQETDKRKFIKSLRR